MNGRRAEVLLRSVAWGVGIGLATGAAAGAGLGVAIAIRGEPTAVVLAFGFGMFGAAYGLAIAVVPTVAGGLVLAGVALLDPTPRQLHVAAWLVVVASLGAFRASAVDRGMEELLLALPVAIGVAVPATRSIAHSHSMVPGGFDVMS